MEQDSLFVKTTGADVAFDSVLIFGRMSVMSQEVFPLVLLVLNLVLVPRFLMMDPVNLNRGSEDVGAMCAVQMYVAGLARTPVRIHEFGHSGTGKRKLKETNNFNAGLVALAIFLVLIIESIFHAFALPFFLSVR